MTRHNHLRLVVSNEKPEEPSPDELSQAERDYLWARLEHVERLAESYRRRLGLIGCERGLIEFEGGEL